jgi:ketosteroid isomerase-like protein
MTDDIVVIHGNGRMLQGKEAVTADFVRTLADVRIQQRVESEETVVAGDWAFDRASIETILTPRSGSDAKRWHSRTMTILRREGPGPWRVARTIGVVQQAGLERTPGTFQGSS